MSLDQTNHCVEIIQNINSSDPQRADATTCKPAITDCVVRNLKIVMRSVYLDTQLGRVAVEIQDVRAGRMLAAKTHTDLLPAQSTP